MTDANNHLRFCCFNCRSLKSSLKELIQLCDTHDVIFLQETWLLSYELSMLQNVHNYFIGFWDVSSRFHR